VLATLEKYNLITKVGSYVVFNGDARIGIADASWVSVDATTGAVTLNVAQVAGNQFLVRMADGTYVQGTVVKEVLAASQAIIAKGPAVKRWRQRSQRSPITR